MSSDIKGFPPGTTLRVVREDGAVSYGNRSEGDIAVIPDNGGVRVVEFGDDQYLTVVWGDVRIPLPAGTCVCPKFCLSPAAGKHRGEWFPTKAACIETMRPYLISAAFTERK